MPNAFAIEPFDPVASLRPDLLARLSTCAASRTDVVAIPPTFAIAKPITRVSAAPIRLGKKLVMLVNRFSIGAK